MSQAENYNSIYIRNMEIDDIAPVYHLGESVFTSDLYPYLYRTWDEWEVIGLYNTDPEYCLVAEIDEQLAGFVLGTIINKATWTYGYIIWLGVNSNFQRRGVGDKLVDKLVERMIEDGVRFMLVDTDPANTPAVKFFTRKGFGNTRQHIFLSMNLSKHEYYGRLIAYEREKAERAAYKRSRRRPSTKTSEVVNEVATKVMVTDSELPDNNNPDISPIS
ncbi:GNAT family N-acetyltransferase [Floridanema aerugineum]|uniref:GNAT family N-acetyltransferase n=1 Tax=Floridaenema aerugineum BLCC-F46 TaxID=3153654 RepID=A0ABV4XHD7_9CYAN